MVYKVRTCTYCNAKRRIYVEQTANALRYMRCSKDHRWTEEIATLDKINAIFKEIFIDSVRESMTSGPGTFLYDLLRK